jgi:hypothetical protein
MLLSRLAPVALLAVYAARAQEAAPALDSIARDELAAEVHFLASDLMRGRLTGSPEAALAARYIESRFRRLHLKPLGPEGAFLQPFTLYWAELAESNQLRLHLGAGLERQARLLEDFSPSLFAAEARARGQAVFAGYGIEALELGWNDLSGDLAGRILLVLDGEPGADDPKSPFDGLVTSIHADALRKILNAQRRGASGVLFVDPSQGERGANRFPEQARSQWPAEPPRIKRYALAAQAGQVRIPAAAISPALAQTLLGGRKLADLAARAQRGNMQPVPLAGVEVELETHLRRHYLDDHNVIAALEGADPKLQEEAVIVSAHYDHNGADASGVFNGADDNASGVAGLLEIAEAYALAARNHQRPARTVVFAAWGSEERCCGPLLGAWFWTQFPWWPLEKTVAVLNMDMIGRSEEVPEGGGSRFRGLAVQTAALNANAVNLIGTSFSPDLREAARAANSGAGLELKFRYDNNRSNLLRRSDHWPFLQNGVPALFIHTGLHPDYHTIYDRPEKIDYAKMTRITRLVYQLSWNLARQETRPRFLKPRPLPEPD